MRNDKNRRTQRRTNRENFINIYAKWGHVVLEPAALEEPAPNTELRACLFGNLLIYLENETFQTKGKRIVF